MSEVKFYRCNHCGNIVAVVEDGGVTPVCCGEKMQLLVAGTTDAAVEKHVPVVSYDDTHAIVHVGEVDHPMTEAHLIDWIAMAKGDTLVIKHLHAGDAPEARFGKCCCEGATFYAYCNLHGLWKAEA